MDECISIFKAWLLSREGIAIPVYKHPNPKYQFDEILLLSKEYGDEGVKELCSEYERSPSGSLQEQIVSYYRQNWCKVRAWGIFNDELTFRICPDSFDWYPVNNAVFTDCPGAQIPTYLRKGSSSIGTSLIKKLSPI